MATVAKIATIAKLANIAIIAKIATANSGKRTHKMGKPRKCEISSLFFVKQSADSSGIILRCLQ